ncbi:Polynucleotide 5'-hydroxyl-kinase grc3 [Blastocladiella emersonii ATCC 22665]|nr:Polynucleotide 5'-hydroxyl-kinase grc3 [Blastocladiella emersonii ATCC 22665]
MKYKLRSSPPSESTPSSSPGPAAPPAESPNLLEYTTVPLNEAKTTASDGDVTLVGFQHGQTFCFQGYCLVGAVQGAFSVYNFLAVAPPREPVTDGVVPPVAVLHPCFAPSTHSLPVLRAVECPASTQPAPVADSQRAVAVPPTSPLGKRIARLLAKLQAKNEFDAVLALVDFSWAQLHAVHGVTPEFVIFDPRDRENAGLAAKHPRVPVPHVTPVVGPVAHTSTLATPESWQAALHTVLADAAVYAGLTELESLAVYPTVVATGAKSYGKSTFNRMAVNVLLSTFPEVAFLDLDVGQAEFTAPGVLALTVVDHPVLGPGYWSRPHSGRTNHVAAHFYGAASPQSDPDLYWEQAAHLIGAYRAYADSVWARERRVVPLVVNTMGWVRGLGYMLLEATVRAVVPTHVVVLEHAASDRDAVPVDELLRPWTETEGAEEEGGEESAAQGQVFVPRVIKATALRGMLPNAPKLNPADLRTLALAAHLLSRPGASLARVLAGNDAGGKDPAWLNAAPLTSPTYPTLRAPLHRVHAAFPHADIPRAELLRALNSMLVALVGCTADPRASVTASIRARCGRTGAPTQSRRAPTAATSQYLGMAVVRGISGAPAHDPSRRVLFLASPVPLADVGVYRDTALVRGELELPNWIAAYGLPPATMGASVVAPYLSAAMGEGTGSVAQRTWRGVPRQGHARGGGGK